MASIAWRVDGLDVSFGIKLVFDARKGDALRDVRLHHPLKRADRLPQTDSTCTMFGIDFAMALTARIVPDPLGDHDPKPLIDEAQKRYVEIVMRRRDAYARELARKKNAA